MQDSEEIRNKEDADDRLRSAGREMIDVLDRMAIRINKNGEHAGSHEPRQEIE